jgi:[ribosomal protein S18]-alanine N-acetyltransferase
MSGVPMLKFSRKGLRMCPKSEPGLDQTPFTVRRYQPGDSESVSEISRKSPQAAQWPKESYDQAHSSGQIVLIAELSGQICGFVVARIIAEEAEILNTAVDPAHRRQGIGTALLSAAISSAQTQNAKSIYLEVRESNSAAITFYQQHGFEKTTQRRQYYSSPTENAVVMKKLTA